jgi:HAD superfamily hydrolase (TIGR01509 family)
MFEAIIWDFGRVISAPRPNATFRRYEEELGLAPGVLNRIMFGSPAWQETLVGRRTLDDYWQAIGPALGLQTAGEIEAFRHRYFGDEAPNAGVLDLIHQLYRRYKLAVLSNAPPRLSTWLSDWDLLDLFDVVVCSGDVGVVKPDPAIFRIALDRLAVEPQAAVFIDDTLGHVEAARALGLCGLHFTGPEALAGELKTLGIL